MSVETDNWTPSVKHIIFGYYPITHNSGLIFGLKDYATYVVWCHTVILPNCYNTYLAHNKCLQYQKVGRCFSWHEQ